MSDGTIDSYLVALGFKIDSAGQQKFTDALARAKVGALAMAAALTGVVATVAKVAESYEQLAYQSQRMGVAVGNIRAFGYAISQVGGSAAGAAQSLEAMGSFLRSGPGAESFLTRLGIQTRTATGEMRDTSQMMTELGARFRTMPYYRAKAYAGVLGMDERTLQALMRGTGQFSDQLKDMYKRAGVDAEEASRGSVLFMQRLRGFGAALQVLRDKVAISLQRGVGGDIDRLRRLLVDNFGRISAVIVAAAKFVTALGWALVQLAARAAEIVGRLIDWFNHLDSGTKRWIETIGLLAGAWYLLNKTFLATPIGRIVAAGAAILALYDDYKVWKEGGKHLIDWDAWKPGIDAATDAIGTFKKLLSDFWPNVRPYLLPAVDFFKHEFLDAFKTTATVMGDLFRALDDAANGHWGAAGKDLRKALSDGMASGVEGQQAASDLLSTESRASGGAFVSGSTSRNEAAGYGILRSLGLDRVHALAMLGNFEQESSLDPTKRNGNHFGIAQWSTARADALQSQTGIDVRTAGYADQLKAAAWEVIYGNERGNAKGFFSAKDLTTASGLFATDLERSGEHPGSRGFDNRIKNSMNADHRLRFADGGGGVTNNTGGSPRVQQNVSISVTGAGNPEAVGKSVLRHQDYASEALVRNMKPLAL